MIKTVLVFAAGAALGFYFRDAIASAFTKVGVKPLTASDAQRQFAAGMQRERVLDSTMSRIANNAANYDPNNIQIRGV